MATFCFVIIGGVLIAIPVMGLSWAEALGMYLAASLGLFVTMSLCSGW